MWFTGFDFSKELNADIINLNYIIVVIFTEVYKCIKLSVKEF